jgi:hypothetical protein
LFNCDTWLMSRSLKCQIQFVCTLNWGDVGLLFHSWCDILILLVLKSLKTYYQVFLNSIQVDFFSCMENAQ